MRNFLVTEAGAVRGLLFQTGLIPDADIFVFFFSRVFFGAELKKRSGASRWRWEGEKKEGGGLVISPRGSERVEVEAQRRVPPLISSAGDDPLPGMRCFAWPRAARQI